MIEILKFLHKELGPPSLACEQCLLHEAGKRVLAEDVASVCSVPHYDESTRDGYALGAALDAATHSFKLIKDEAFAGNTDEIFLQPGQACAVMTGGLIPLGAKRVVPKELATVSGGRILKVCELSSLPDYIKKAGSEVERGEVVLQEGTLLLPEHLALLAENGHSEVTVYKRPRVGFFGTGSELVEAGDELAPGQKVASNRYLLSGLCASFGADVYDLGIVSDSQEELNVFFETLKESHFDIIISTGGMGPGKYDLLEKTFASYGGKIVTNSLPLAPGKSTLVGWLANTLFFGLPGNPSAIRPLFTELIAPAILSLQGLKDCFPLVGQAILQTPLSVKRTKILTLCPGKFEYKGITKHVSVTQKGEVANCYILLFPERGALSVGTVAMIHETRSPFGE